MLFVQSGVSPGDTVLVQGAGGGVATALIVLARAGGLPGLGDQPERRRSSSGRVELGAHEAFDTGARLPARVDAVFETVGEATWSHSLKSLRPGGTLVVSGRHQRSQPAGRAQPGVLPPAAGDRLHDGHPR